MLREQFSLALQAAAGAGSSLPFDHTSNYAVQATRIDNLTDRWLLLEPDHAFVPPWTMGIVHEFFVQAQHVTLKVQNPPGVTPDTVSGTDQGIVSIELYDTSLYPFPGYRVNLPDIYPRDAFAGSDRAEDTDYGLQTSQLMEMQAAVLMLRNANIQGTHAYQAVRELSFVSAGHGNCIAGNWTGIAQSAVAGNPPRMNRIMLAQFSVESSCRIQWRAIATQEVCFDQYVFAMMPQTIAYPLGGYMQGVGGSSSGGLECNPDVTTNVALSVGFGLA